MDKLDFAIKNYLNPKGGRGYILKTLYYLSNYAVTVKGSKDADVLMFFNNGFRFREDHYEQFEKVYLALQQNGVKVTLMVAKRELSMAANFSFKKQFESVFSKVGINFKKVLVFCDSIPLQNFLVSKFKNLNIPTYSLQHGFYIEDSNEIFLNVYKSSNADSFFIWDERTLSYMKKHNPNRNYILTGPHTEAKLDVKKRIENNKHEIAIFGCGKDQKKENSYLKKVYDYLMSNGIKSVIISHPKWNLLDKMSFYVAHRVWLKPNKLKHESFKLSLILNSTVFRELKNRNESYKILNSYFESNVIPTIEELFSENDNVEDKLQPFFDEKESLEIIVKTMSNDL